MPGRLTETTLFVLANPECPHCVRAVDTMTDWAVEEHIPVAGVDVRHHPQIEDAWALETSPVLVFRRTHGEHVQVGMPDRAEFARLVQAQAQGGFQRGSQPPLVGSRAEGPGTQ